MKYYLLCFFAILSLSILSCERNMPLTAGGDLVDRAVINEEEEGNLADNPWDPCYNPAKCGNCVFYAACRMGIVFPLDLTKIENKCKLINRTYPQVGFAVIIDAARPYGHIAYISYVANSGTIYIHEGNWNGGCNYRSISPNDATIIGYYDPSIGPGQHDCGYYGH